MKKTTLTVLLQIAGFLHLGLLCAGALMPRAVNLRGQLAGLPPFIRQLFWVYYTFIGLCILSFGLITYWFAGILAAGGNLAFAVCLFLALFWTLRLTVAALVFDLRPYLTTAARRLGYHALNVVFLYLPIVYLLAAWRGGPL
jgi:hypothetical protein